VKKPTVLHITPHMPGGLGRVLLSTLKYSYNNRSSFNHEIIITDAKHLTNNVLKMFSKYSKSIYLGKKNSFIKKKIEEADIVQIEYWNHPMIYKFLDSFIFPKARVIFCLHNNGLSRPTVITKSIIDFCDIFLSTTKATRKHPLFRSKNKTVYIKKLKFIKYPVDFERFKSIELKKHKGFNVGYIGTVDYSKMHEKIFSMSAATNIPNSKFIICGDGSDKDKVKKEVKNYPTKKFQCIGFVENVKKVLEKLDVFGYPLNPNHFGSGEQVILEAMYAGLPVVAFSNPSEKEIIENKKTGILVDSEDEYTKAIEFLYKRPMERKRIGDNAKRHITLELKPEKCFTKLNNIYFNTMKLKKKTRVFPKLIKKNKNEDNDLGARLFIKSLEDQGLEFKKSYRNHGKKINIKINKIISKVEFAMKTKTKGSIFQYLYFFPEDAYLNFWAGLISIFDKNILKGQDASIAKTTIDCFQKAIKKQKKNKEFQYYIKQAENNKYL
jgi:glycosyltransferase involved in cell wall biosynthesis